MKKKVIATMSAIVVVFSLVLSQLSSVLVTAVGESFTGFIKEGSPHVLNTQQVSDPTKTYIAYCFNTGLSFPETAPSSTLFTSVEASPQNLLDYAEHDSDKSSTHYVPLIQDGEELQQTLADVIYNGYRTNASGIMNGLTPE